MKSKITCPSCKKQIQSDDDSHLGGLFTCPECEETSIISALSIKEGDIIGGFKLEKQIGEGGMGTVWLAKHENKNSAIKVLHPYLSQNEDYIKRFLKESKLTSKLEHPNIVKTYATGQDNNYYYLALSFIDGKSLKEYLETSKTFPEKEGLKVVKDIAEALKYSWNNFKIVHRDIKPDNIMIDKEGNGILMDMGISKSLQEKTMLTMSGIIVGTPYYISPEQASADKNLDFRADLYSLGGTLYHAVTGELPFNATNTMSLLALHKTEAIKPPILRNPQLSRSCSNLILNMMVKNPKHRYDTWDKLIKDIDKAINNKKVKLNKHAVVITEKSKRRKKILKIVILANIAFLAIIFLLSYFVMKKQEYDKKIKRQKQELSQIDSFTKSNLDKKKNIEKKYNNFITLNKNSKFAKQAKKNLEEYISFYNKRYNDFKEIKTLLQGIPLPEQLEEALFKAKKLKQKYRSKKYSFFATKIVNNLYLMVNENVNVKKIWLKIQNLQDGKDNEIEIQKNCKILINKYSTSEFANKANDILNKLNNTKNIFKNNENVIIKLFDEFEEK